MWTYRLINSVFYCFVTNLSLQPNLGKFSFDIYGSRVKLLWAHTESMHLSHTTKTIEVPKSLIKRRNTHVIPSGKPDGN